MSEDENVPSEARLTTLRRVYDTELAPVVDEFYATIRSNETVGPFAGEGLVGLLTFPNSGTSWFLRLTARISGLYNHTAYEKESLKTKGEPSRGVHTLRFLKARPPEPGEPSFVKSHVRYYGGERFVVTGARDFAHHAKYWAASLPPNCDRHIRLVRNPLDNLRARYHLYLKSHAAAGATEPLDFRSYFRPDLRRYLQWHAYCDELAATMPIMTVHYENYLDPSTAVETLGRAMRFAGYDVDDERIAFVLTVERPKYDAEAGLPLHLAHFDEEDIRWVAAEITDWIAFHDRIREGRPGLTTRLRRLIGGLGRSD
jgi:hypothetical protein